MKALIVDNYDSFTYNLYQLVASLFEDVKVKRNDQLEIGEVNDYDTVFISPGPGRPGVIRDVGLSEEIVRNFPQKPILGVCLGHQIIGHVYGAKIVQSSHIMHGKKSLIIHSGESIFRGLPHFYGGRYHSLVINKVGLPEELQVLGISDDGEIMAIKHIKYPHYGVQFHPESILTQYGEDIIKNFLEEVK